MSTSRLAFAALAAWIGCVSETPQGLPCTADGLCPDNQECFSGICYLPEDAPDGGIGPDPETEPPPDCEILTCECVTNLDCGGEHEECITTGMLRSCECGPGYADVDGVCVWVGVLSESFTDPSTWQSLGGAVVDSTSGGQLDPGAAYFDANAVCNLGSLSRVVDMPSADHADALILRVNHQTVSGNAGENVGVAIGIDGKWIEVDRRNTFGTDQICLGEAAYGGPVEFKVSPRMPSILCGSPDSAEITVDRLSVDLAAPGVCPAIGEIPNPNFDTDDVWSPVTGRTGVAEIVGGAGADGSRAARLSVSTYCSNAIIEGQVSVPVRSMRHPALRFTQRGTADRLAYVRLGDRNITTVLGTGAFETTTVCLPEWSKGLVHRLRFQINSPGGLCATDYPSELIVDDLEIVDVPSCESANGVQDGAFEQITHPTIAITNTAGASARVVSGDPTGAYADSGYLEFSTSQTCTSAQAAFTIEVPRALAGAGPALKFFYRSPSNPNSDLRYQFPETFGPNDGALLETGNWAEHTTCINRTLAGRLLDFRFQHLGITQDCGAGFAVESAFVDELRLTTDPSCP